MGDEQIRLTEADREKIRLEEVYRNEVKKGQPNKRALFALFDGLIKAIQALAIVVGIYLSLRQYSDNSKHEREEAARDYQKAFYQAQMNVYAEVVNAASTLATTSISKDSAEYKVAREKFWQLFWGRMSMFEDKCVEAKMVAFRKLLLKYEQKDYSPIQFQDPCSIACTYDTVTVATLRLASLQLAHQCRIRTITKWLEEKDQESYNLIDSIPCR